ncbi:MAG: pyruvate dehydrogenase complex dihydrolipoamide acetyltransferase [Ferruginibacter sp.]
MAEVIRMPRLSDTMTEGIISEWHKKVGDDIKPGDILADVETDKATMELESYNEGRLLFIGVAKGNPCVVDGILAIVGKEGEDFKALLKGDKSSSKEEKKPAEPVKPTEPAKGEEGNNKKIESKASLPQGAKEIRMPLLSDTMTEGKIISWNKKVGDKVKSDDVLAEVETDKATMEVIGYEEGTLLYTGVEAGKAAKVNDIIAIIGREGTDVNAYLASQNEGENETKASAHKAEEPEKAETNSSKGSPVLNEKKDDRIKASPLAKKLAMDKGIDIGSITGSGDGGRITKKDVDDFQPSQSGSNAPMATDKNNNFSVQGEESFRDIPLSQIRKVIAKRLSESMYSAPHFYLTMEINMDNATAARTTINEVSPVKISYNDMLIKACAAALRLHPAINSSWISGKDGDFIRENHHVHIGSAVALPEGLIVPVIKFADRKNLSQIAAEAKGLYAKAKDKKLQPEDFTGNTFTISNLGMMGVEEFTAIINPPDSCILAVGSIKEIVVFKNSQFAHTSVMKVTLSCDHRSVDGSVGASFLQTLKKFIENPITMLV